MVHVCDACLFMELHGVPSTPPGMGERDPLSLRQIWLWPFGCGWAIAIGQ